MNESYSDGERRLETGRPRVSMGCPNPCVIEQAGGIRGCARAREEERNRREIAGFSVAPEFGDVLRGNRRAPAIDFSRWRRSLAREEEVERRGGAGENEGHRFEAGMASGSRGRHGHGYCAVQGGRWFQR
jgi:hypothetical protein